MRKWTHTLTAALLTFGVALAGCGGGNQPAGGSGGSSQQPQAQPQSQAAGAAGGQPIKIGFFADITGGAASLGKAEADTARLVEEMLNARGGIKGRKVEIAVIDSKSQEQEAVLAAKKLIQDGVAAIVGGTTTGASMAVVNTVEQEQIPFVSLAAGATIVNPVKKWVFKTPQTDSLAVAKILEYLKARNITRVAWISSNNAYGDSGRVEFEKLARAAGLEIVASERYNLDDKDMTAQLTRIKGANPGAVINWSIPPTASLVTKNFKQLGFTVPLIQSHGVANGAYLEQSGEAANGVILPAGHLLIADQMKDSDPRKQVMADYMAAYKKKYNAEANSFGGYAYDALMMVARAIENAGDDRARIRDYLETGIKNFPGITGTFTMTAQDHMGLSHGDSFELIEIKGGKWSVWVRP